jgi:hypothetical protein
VRRSRCPLTVEELICTGVDYVVVACPTVFHLEVGLALAEAGVHALIEKPLADTGARRSGWLIHFTQRPRRRSRTY